VEGKVLRKHVDLLGRPWFATVNLRSERPKTKGKNMMKARLCLQGRGALREDITRYLSWGGVQTTVRHWEGIRTMSWRCRKVCLSETYESC